MNDYIRLALKTEPSPEQYAIIIDRVHNPEIIRLLHAAMGLETEVGELMDQLKKHIFYGKELDLVNLSEELGDLNWYQAICIDALSNLLNVNNTDLEESIKSTNISKLSARYPNLFTGEDAINRNTNKERQILENNG